MQLIDTSFILVIISTFLCIFLMRYSLKNKPVSQIQKLLASMFACSIIILVGLIVQKIAYVVFHIEPTYFEFFIYIGTCFFPVTFFLMALAFVNTKIKITKKYALLIVVPITTLLIILTNNYHHLFYNEFSFNLSEMEYGPHATVHLIYTYGLFLIGSIMMIIHSSKNSGFFSKQSLLIIAGILTPVIVNVLGTLNILQMNIYSTPIAFAFTLFFFSLAIFKFNFLSVTPIALEKVVDRMSDSYLVLNDKNVIIDFNKSFLSTFKLKEQNIRNTNILDWNKTVHLANLQTALETVSVSPKTLSFESKVDSINKYFNIEISSIVNKNMFLGVLILFKDITQHMQDLDTIKSNQDMLIEKERFASLRSNDWWYCA